VLKNSRHEKFAIAVAAGKTHRAAYADVYGVAGASADAAATRLFSFAQVAARIAELKQAAAAASGIETARVLNEIAKTAFANVMDFGVLGPDGLPRFDFSLAGYDRCAALASIETEEFMDGAGDDARPVRRVKFKLNDKIAALTLLCKHLGLLSPTRVVVTGPGGGPIETKLTDTDRARRIAFFLGRVADRKAGVSHPDAPPPAAHAWRDPAPAAPPQPEAEPEPAVDAEAALAALLGGQAHVGDDAAVDAVVLDLLQTESRNAASRYHNGAMVDGTHYACDRFRRLHEQLREARGPEP
jgi:phage terminase small subunit